MWPKRHIALEKCDNERSVDGGSSAPLAIYHGNALVLFGQEVVTGAGAALALAAGISVFVPSAARLLACCPV